MRTLFCRSVLIFVISSSLSSRACPAKPCAKPGTLIRPCPAKPCAKPGDPGLISTTPTTPKKHIEYVFIHGTHGALLPGKLNELWRDVKSLYSDRLMSGKMGLVAYEDLERDINAPYILDAFE